MSGAFAHADILAALGDIAVLFLANALGLSSAIASFTSQRRNSAVLFAALSSLSIGILLVAWAAITSQLSGLFAVLCGAPLACGAFGLLRFGFMRK